MKLVAVTRIMNEDDIVEAFVRHHRGQIDHHLFLDNGSVDRTIEILRALQAEGVPLTVLQNNSPIYVETSYNTSLFNIAARNLGADWVLFLDTDEFIDARAAPQGVRALIEAVPAEINCLTVRVVPYFDTSADDAGDLLVPRRMRRRHAAPDPSVTKVFVRGSLAGSVEIDAGQHCVLFNGKQLPDHVEPRLVLAHYYRRGPHQLLWKSAIGRLKVLAAGRREIEKQRSFHYNETFATLRDDPARLLRDAGWMAPSYAWEDLVDDPIRYDGEALRHTAAMDGAMKAMRILAAYGESLAREFGQIIDSNEGVRVQVEKAAAVWVRLF
jgi:glycosyltransferase involved in cell wall biosynthesis